MKAKKNIPRVAKMTKDRRPEACAARAEAIKDENESWGTVVVVAILMVAFLEYNTAQKEGGLPWWFVWALYDLIWVATALTYAQLVMAGDEVRTQVVGGTFFLP